MTNANPLPPFAVTARFFDGQSAGEKLVRAVADEVAGRLTIYDEERGQALETWPLDELRMIRDPGYGDGIVFFRNGHNEARLNVQSSVDAAAIEGVAPNLRKVEIVKGTVRKMLVWSAAAAGSVALILFVILPALADNLSGLVPIEREEAMGRQVVNQMERMLGSYQGSGYCTNEAGQAALQKMATRLTDQIDMEYELKLRVIRHPMVNAFAAPGGHVVVVSGLLEKADTPEEVAGILAHEIGHVVNRDPLRIMLRAAGSAGILSMLIGDFAGGTLALIVSEQLMQASFTREAEAAADVFAFETLSRAKLPTEDTAHFFEKLRDQYGDTEGAMEYLSSHPNLASRALAARSAETQTTGKFEPVLSAQEWQALKSICN